MDHPSNQPSPSKSLALAPSENRGLQLTSLKDIRDFAQIVVGSGLAPRSFSTAEQVIIALVSGAELGISPMQALQGLSVVQGKIGIMGDLALALCMAHPSFEDHKEEEIGEGDGAGIRFTVKRRGRSPISSTFTVKDAKLAKLWGKSGPWSDYPKRMLRYRALGFALRDAFTDVLKGIKTAEELQDYPDEPRRGIDHAKLAKVASTVSVKTRDVEDENDAVLVEESPGVFTTEAPPKKETKLPERKRLFATGLLTDFRNKKNDNGLEFWGATLGNKTLYTPHAHMGEKLAMFNNQQVKVAHYASLIPATPNRVEVVGIELNSPEASRSRAKARHEGPDDVQDEWSAAEASHLRKLIEEDDLSEVWILKSVQKLGWPRTDADNLGDLEPGILRAIVRKWTEVANVAHILEQGEELPVAKPVEEPKQDREEPAHVS